MPLAEHDAFGDWLRAHWGVSIHVPLAEHDHLHTRRGTAIWGFNSRAPRGARLLISAGDNATKAFQFTCPSRSTTSVGLDDECGIPVSIHVPLAEHDSSSKPSASSLLVSIHVPLAEHDDRLFGTHLSSGFQFTCPSRSTTCNPTLQASA